MKTKDLALSGLFLAILIVCSWIIIPVGAVPISLSIFAVFLIGAMLSPFNAIVVCVTYLILGLIGLPVFSSFGAGVAILLGPTGGYLLSYPLVAAAVSISVKFGKKIGFYILGMSIALVLCYGLGITMLMINHITLKGAIISGVLPFILPDIAKIALASTLAHRLNLIINKQTYGVQHDRI